MREIFIEPYGVCVVCLTYVSLYISHVARPRLACVCVSPVKSSFASGFVHVMPGNQRRFPIAFLKTARDSFRENMLLWDGGDRRQAERAMRRFAGGER